MSLAIITSLFNPMGFSSRANNFQKFRQQFRPGELFVIEASFDGNFISDGLHVPANESNIMWQKERMLNRVVQLLPPEYDKIAWVDADVLFNNPLWKEQTEKMLDSFPVVQCFDTARMKTRRKRGRTHIYHAAGSGRNPIQPGMAWAAIRDFFPLYDRAIVGGGDRLTLWAIQRCRPKLPGRWRDSWKKWADVRFPKGLRWGTVPGTVVHLWHGNQDHRQYAQRYSILQYHDFDPGQDIQIDSNGWWRWTGNKPELEREVREYFKSRREDE